MMPLIVNEQAPVPPPAYHRAQARLGPALHIDALTLVNTLHLLALCRLAVHLAYRRCPPPLPSLVQEGHLERTACSLRSCGRCGDSRDLDMRDWLRSWPALALACGLRAFAKMDIPAFPALHSNASAGNKQEPHCRKLSSSSAS